MITKAPFYVTYRLLCIHRTLNVEYAPRMPSVIRSYTVRYSILININRTLSKACKNHMQTHKSPNLITKLFLETPNERRWYRDLILCLNKCIKKLCFFFLLTMIIFSYLNTSYIIFSARMLLHSQFFFLLFGFVAE